LEIKVRKRRKVKIENLGWFLKYWERKREKEQSRGTAVLTKSA